MCACLRKQAGSPSFSVGLLRSGLSIFCTKYTFRIRDAIFLLSQIKYHSHPRIKWSVCFGNFLKVSCYAEISDVSPLKRESHYLTLRASRAGILPASEVPRVSISTLQWTPESLSDAGFGDTWPCEDSIFQLFPARAPRRWCQLQPWQLDQGRSCMGCWKHRSEMKVSHTMLSQRRRGQASPL